MTEIIIIEKSFLVRYALKRLILEIDERYRMHELATVSELKDLTESIGNVIIIINQDQLPADHQNYFKKLNLHHPEIVLFSNRKEKGLNSDEVIFLNDTGTSVLKKLKEALGTEKDQHHESADSKILSDRETDVLRCVALGMTNKEIARRLFLSIHTIIAHRKNISAKLGIRTIAGFTVYALLNNIILPDDINK